MKVYVQVSERQKAAKNSKIGPVAVTGSEMAVVMLKVQVDAASPEARKAQVDAMIRAVRGAQVGLRRVLTVVMASVVS